MCPLRLVAVALKGILLGTAIEFVTIMLRFGLGLSSVPCTRPIISRFTGGFRVHHGYVGMACMALAPLAMRLPEPAAAWLGIAGLGLFLSDAAHHFLVLWPRTGDHEFRLRYPEGEESRVAS
jgi:hypothetical protein